MKLLLSTLVLFASSLGFASPVPTATGDLAAIDVLAPQEPMRPGPQHAMLQKLAGTWDAVVITKDATGAEQKTKGRLVTQKHTDFHTVDSYEGEFMGMKMLGHGINGYCTVKKQFFTFWTDSMTPSPMTVTGDYDSKKRELVMTGECHGMSGKLEKCRTVTSYQDDDHYAWVFFGSGPDGKVMQFLRIEYTRAK